MKPTYFILFFLANFFYIVPELFSYQNVLENISIYSEFSCLSKTQTSYYTPLDNPIWAIDFRSGANHREDQIIRTAGEIDLCIGKPGEKFFGLLQFYFDANDPDFNVNEQEEAYFDTGNIFINYRPFEFYGGRPFGITVGIQPIKATANAAYSYIFSGDFEEDFILYTCNFLNYAPAVTFDLHFSKTNGIGFSYSQKAPDISNIAFAINTQHANSKIFWVEMEKWNFNFNLAYQIVDGEQYATKINRTNNGNIYYSYQNDHRHRLFNSLIRYTIEFKKNTIIPWFGYQKLFGDEAQLPYLEEIGYGDRYISAYTLNYGFSYQKNKFLFVMDFSELHTPKLGGIDALPYGYVNELIKPIYSLFPTSNNYTWSNTPIEGLSHSVYYAAGLGSVAHIEFLYEISKHIKIGAFMYFLNNKNDNTIGNENSVKQQLTTRITSKLMKEANIDNAEATEITNKIMNVLDNVEIHMDGQTATIFNQIMYACKVPYWEDTHSIGMFVRYSF
ncbi:MAG: hypothetical protein KJ737_04500 [Proteobacteria bacterium]|nr:hypothetical protein [Pseudomonadota bacterium]